MSHISQLDDILGPLVRRAQAGEAAARDELLRRCHATVYRWAMVHTGDTDDAEDVAQEVLVIVYRSLDRYAGRSRFTTWLYQVTRHAALGLRRRIASRLHVARAVAARPPEPSGARDPLEQVHESQVAQVVMTLFRELPRRQREIFYLADLEGFAPVEIAERLGMNPVTVRAHLLRARRALRARLLERHPELTEGRTP